MTGLQPVRPQRAADLIATQLRRRIITSMEDGTALPPEAVLMERFQVARQTLRDAFRVLETEGLLTVRRGAQGGAIVHRPDGSVAARSAALVLASRGASLADVYRARAVLEPSCAALLARNRRADDVATLRGALEQTADTDAVSGIRDLMGFHRLVAHLAGNHTVALLTDLVRHIVEAGSEEQVVADPQSSETERAQRLGHRTHVRLVDLIEQGDHEAARELWRRHLEESEDYLIRGAGSRTVLDLL
ncbi:FadR family transcriptional regulator [Pseudonocardia sp. KRD-184]|uniref:FadR family transcriptional regulator n=1 Tax=Pseudonocardia oceani TaxID=2792013 RepID=A0ABS6U4B4_9PSEU|nr:FadR family transcriptional regulator [Pseudonocardia oceani]MBW0097450.1 FadR family transcriptional regulator [Pseudonocardia oceani]MBW0123770.1 FadR family transcriptional regulator [Pseudonocardia oceani]MBW0127065.1 FadR family transcriptional regulator [Pseudonocardia oceani]